MDDEAAFRHALSGQPLTAGDVIFLLVGDGLYRVPHAARLYKEGYAPGIAITGDDDRRDYGSFPASEMVAELKRNGVPGSAIHVRADAPHTRAEAESFLRLARETGWKTALLTTSPHHQYRAFLTFVKAMSDLDIQLTLVNSPAPLSLTEKTPWGTRGGLQAGETRRIMEYGLKGDVASFSDGIAYLQAHGAPIAHDTRMSGQT
jgi:uncharacterized SAM-binding protein YcdF (DUF218 family)